MPEASHAALVAYLRTHGQSHAIETLRAHLVAEGHAEEAVDTAVQAYLARETSGVPTRPTPTPETLLAYLRRYGQQHGLQALRDQLIAETHDAAAVEAAVQAYLAERRASSGSSGMDLLRATATAILAVVALAILLVGGCVGGYLVIMTQESDKNTSHSLGVVVLVVLFLVVLVFGALIRAIWRKRPASSGVESGGEKSEEDAGSTNP